jgi:hypothetical protein
MCRLIKLHKPRSEPLAWLDALQVDMSDKQDRADLPRLP